MEAETKTWSEFSIRENTTVKQILGSEGRNKFKRAVRDPSKKVNHLSKVIWDRASMSGEFDSRNNSYSTKFDWRPRVFVKLSFRDLWFKIFCFTSFDNPFSANPTKWSNTPKQFVGNLPTNCLSVFDHFVGLTLKGLIQNLGNGIVFLVWNVTGHSIFFSWLWKFSQFWYGNVQIELSFFLLHCSKSFLIHWSLYLGDTSKFGFQ